MTPPPNTLGATAWRRDAVVTVESSAEALHGVIVSSGSKYVLDDYSEIPDSGWELAVEHRKGNLESRKSKGSGDPRPAHVRNFLDCVKSRNPPALNLELGHHVSTVAHLGNIAFRSGKKITWDATNEKVIGDHEADKLVGVKYRKPWKLPYAKRE